MELLNKKFTFQKGLNSYICRDRAKSQVTMSAGIYCEKLPLNNYNFQSIVTFISRVGYL